MKRALVVSGGGSKGAFAVGVLKRLFNRFPNLKFDMLVGSSTGSLIVPLAAIGEMQMLEDLYTRQKTENIVLQGRLGARINTVSIFDASPLKALIQKTYTQQKYDAIKTSGVNVFVTTTCLQTEQLVVFTTDSQPAASNKYGVRTCINADHFQRAILASACQPVFMQPIMVNKNVPGEVNPGFQFVDGSIREYAGIQMAIDNGATEIFTILLSAKEQPVDTAELKDLFGILQRTVDIFTEDVGKNDVIIPQQYNEALTYIDAVKQKMVRNGIDPARVKEFFTIQGRVSPFEEKVPLQLFFIQPSKPLNGGPGGLTFDPAAMKDMVVQGTQVADNFVASLKPGDITWA